MKLEVDGLTKFFNGVVAVSNLHFEVSSGEITAFVGPNGAGKTTTLRVIAGIEKAEAGTVRVDNISLIAHPEKIAEFVGFVPDTLPNHNDISVYEYLDFFGRAYKIPYRRRVELLNELMSFTSLSDIKDKMLSALSKGMKQRVSVARALINNPPFILMDEPSAGLDPRARIELRELIKVLSSQKKGILISSHILSDLSEICNSVVIIEKGRLLQEGKVPDVVKAVEKTSTRKIVAVLLGESKDFLSFVLQQPYVEKASSFSDNVEFEFTGTASDAYELLKRAIEAGHKIIEYHFQRQNLETVFMNVTKGGVQ